LDVDILNVKLLLPREAVNTTGGPGIADRKRS